MCNALHSCNTRLPGNWLNDSSNVIDTNGQNPEEKTLRPLVAHYAMAEGGQSIIAVTKAINQIQPPSHLMLWLLECLAELTMLSTRILATQLGLVVIHMKGGYKDKTTQ